MTETVDPKASCESISLLSIKYFQISEGSEVIKINKRFFLDNVSNNTLLEIRKLVIDPTLFNDLVFI